MTSPILTSRFVSSEQDVAPVLTAWIGKRLYRTHSLDNVRGADGTLVARVCNVPRLAQLQMLKKAEEGFRLIKAISDEEWFRIFTNAGNYILRIVSPGTNLSGVFAVRLASRTSGLPIVRLVRAWRNLATVLYKIRSIAAMQSPDGSIRAYRTYRNCCMKWAWAPAGLHVAVRIPPNFPTINANWLQALAFRRPVLLSAPYQDPITAPIMVESLYAGGLPDGAVSLCYGDKNILPQLAHQTMWPGVLPRLLIHRARTQLLQYHAGRSKAVVVENITEPMIVQRLARMAFQGCGRLCTNASAIIAFENEVALAEALAQQFNRYRPLPLDHTHAVVPAFPNRNDAFAIADRIRQAISRGGVDVTERAGAGPLLVENAGSMFLRPTVLLLSPTDPLFGAEFPFPFLTVAKAFRRETAGLCRNSLAVSVIGHAPELVEELIAEPSIKKVFWGDEFDRAYDPIDPHEGYVADFLFQKKAITHC